ncbi:integrase arm-type DNA-binding domain-containing protein [Methylobacterium sp. NMS12]|uniref:tyrosine-type recombinase/integrase n=1 Tax=Methylobacterium sp. NMS12 TaxID=3079766 RepID=UPI003F880CAD
MPKITKRVVDALKPDASGEVFAWDSELKGFGVRVMPSGVASYLVKYRTTEGRQRKLAFARVGTITPDEARGLAKEKLAAAARGEDPSADRNRIRQAPTVAEVCDLYLEDAAGRVKASTLAMDRSRIERHVKPLLGTRRIPAVTSDDVEKMRKDIEVGRTARPRQGNGGVTTGGAGVAARTVGMLGTIMEFAVRKKLITTNPARGVWRQPDGKQDRFLSPVEIGRLGRAMRDALNDGETCTGIATLRFLLLTGLRRVEAAALPGNGSTSGAAASDSATPKAVLSSDRSEPSPLWPCRFRTARRGHFPPTGAQDTSWGFRRSWAGSASARACTASRCTSCGTPTPRPRPRWATPSW